MRSNLITQGYKYNTVGHPPQYWQLKFIHCFPIKLGLGDNRHFLFKSNVGLELDSLVC